jgi:hypothetical protein
MRSYNYPTTPDTTIAVGDAVRSYDHAGDTGIFIDGVVVAITTMDGCRRYEIVVTRSERDGNDRSAGRVGARVLPPVNGTETWLGNTTRGVVKLSNIYA